MADTPKPISPAQANDLYSRFLERRARFTDEDEQTSFLVTVLNFGAHLDDVACIAGEWSGTKGQLPPDLTIPTCPNNHPLIESPVQRRLGLIDVDTWGPSSPATAGATDHRNLIFPDSHNETDRAYLSSPQFKAALPDGSLVDGIVVVIAFSDENGQSRWGLHYKANLSVSMAVGIIELAKLELIARTPGAITHLSSEE